jgi:hypothetical protein
MANSISTTSSQNQATDMAKTDNGDMPEIENILKILKNILKVLMTLIDDKKANQSDNSVSQEQKPVLGTDIIGDTTFGQKAVETSDNAHQNGAASASANASVVIQLNLDDSDSNNADIEEDAGNDIKNTTSENSGSDQINRQGDINEEVDIEDESRGGWGDPHYDLIGATGKSIHFDHKGVDYHTYHLFSGDNIRIEGEYSPVDNPKAPQVIGSTTAYLGNDVVTYTKDGNATLNGQALRNGNHMLEDGTEVVKRSDELSIIPNDGSGAVDISAEGEAITVDPSGKFRNLDGIIGKSIEESRPLSKEECDAFDLTQA